MGAKGVHGTGMGGIVSVADNVLFLHLGWWLQGCCPFENIPGAKFTTHALLSAQVMLNGKFN